MRFQTSRLLSGNVWNRELTIIQRGILQRLRNQKRSIQRKIDSRKNLNSYIQSQTTRKWSLFHGDLPITEMHRRRKRSYIPFLLNPETRSDVIPVRLHFRETIPQARQPISHRRVCMNHSIRNIIHLKVSHGDIISFPENDARTHKDNDQKALSSLFPFSIVPFLPMKIGNLYFSLTNASFFLLLSLTFLLFSIHLLS